MPFWTLARVARAVGVAGQFDDRPIAAISTDTRTLPAGAAFVALRGERFDGHDHLDAAVAAGAAVLVVSDARRAPLVGRVSMDYITIDVGRIPGVAVGDRVTLIGDDGEEHIAVEEVAERAGTIPYEITCSVGRRVTRVHKGGEELSIPSQPASQAPAHAPARAPAATGILALPPRTAAAATRELRRRRRLGS